MTWTAAAFVVVTVADVARPGPGPVEAAPILLLTALLAAVFTGRLRRPVIPGVCGKPPL